MIHYVPPQPENFSDLIRALKAQGVCSGRIARLARCSRETVNRLARGTLTEPRYNLGLRLVALYEQNIGERHGGTADDLQDVWPDGSQRSDVAVGLRRR